MDTGSVNPVAGVTWNDITIHPLPTGRDMMVTCYQSLNNYRWFGVHHRWNNNDHNWTKDIVAWAELPKLAEHRNNIWQ